MKKTKQCIKISREQILLAFIYIIFGSFLFDEIQKISFSSWEKWIFEVFSFHHFSTISLDEHQSVVINILD